VEGAAAYPADERSCSSADRRELQSKEAAGNRTEAVSLGSRAAARTIPGGPSPFTPYNRTPMSCLEPGRRLAHYEVLAKIGEGGMGEVYRVRDTKLGRLVALKVLPADVTAGRERLDRFEREARAAAALNHPGIVTLHSIESADGISFLTMELVDGEPLARSIPPEGMEPGALLDLAIPIVEAVQAANEHGITHRDLKPANILVTRQRRPKVLDFGLAKMARADTPESTAETEMRTMEGVVVGTASYMSPEQALGLPVDARSDIFSLGVVFYEMLTGHRPFRGATTTQLIDKLLHAEPEPLGPLDRERASLAAIVGLCLQKDRERRYQSAGELRAALEGLRGGASPAAPATATAIETAAPGSRGSPRRSWAIAVLLAAAAVILVLGGTVARRERPGARNVEKTIAVLPFANLSTDEGNAFFAKGVHEDVMTRLASLEALRIVSRTSVMKFDGYEGSLRDVGKRLGARYVVEGSVQRAEHQVRVTARLVDTSTDQTLWSDSYDRELRNVFALQSEVAEKIATTLQAAIGPDERARLQSVPTGVVGAYDAYLKARSILNASNVSYQQLEEAIGRLKEATEADPRFGEAWALLCRAESDHVERLRELDDRTAEAQAAAREAEAALERARQLDPGGGATLKAEGYFRQTVEKDMVGALQSLDKALALHPSDSETLSFQAMIYLRLGRFDRVVANMEKAYAVDSANGRLVYGLTFAYEVTRRYADMAPFFERLLELEPEKTHYGVEAKYYQFLAEGSLASFRAFEQALKNVRKTSQCDVRSVQNREMVVAMMNGDFETYAGDWQGKWDRHQRGHGRFACPLQINDGANHANLLLAHGEADRARAIIAQARDSATLPYTEMSMCIFDKAAFRPKLDLMSGDAALARREFEEAVPKILENDAFPRGAVERAVLLETADMVAPDRVYWLYRQIVAKPVSLIGMEAICANPWTYPNLLRDPNFVAEVRKDGRFVEFLEHYGLLRG